jgi:DNA-binding MarR family transcriptional regulator
MGKSPDFDLRDFLPYVLNLAAEQASVGFQATYKERYGMQRTDWRALFHLGRYGEMTAREICDRARIHKTKVSRAVAALEGRRHLVRRESTEDRRNELLSLTPAGRAVFDDLCGAARLYDAALARRFTPEDNEVLRRCLRELAQL